MIMPDIKFLVIVLLVVLLSVAWIGAFYLKAKVKSLEADNKVLTLRVEERDLAIEKQNLSIAELEKANSEAAKKAKEAVIRAKTLAAKNEELSNAILRQLPTSEDICVSSNVLIMDYIGKR
jgi:preprotein translocase subunit SecF